jgi:hypothetical protein
VLWTIQNTPDAVDDEDADDDDVDDDDEEKKDDGKRIRVTAPL